MFNLILVVFISFFSVKSYAEHMEPDPKTCTEYGCPRCDCVTQKLSDELILPKAIKEIEKVLVHYGIPLESVKVHVGGEESYTTFGFECGEVCKPSKCCYTFSVLDENGNSYKKSITSGEGGSYCSQ